ncbi:MAG: type IA DNA topoisomerase [Lachnospiraceae bacterium]|nr:type IA DNA topoisomerase [Lachnospiraceae bacterium]
MSKSLFIAEKPSVARQFAEVFSENMKKCDGYLESENTVVTWCVGHLVSMSYPEVYDPALKRWSLKTLPFIPETYLYEVIPNVKKQFDIVSSLLNREDVSTIYVCTDSGREGEYIYRLVRQMANVHDKDERRVWIDSQTEEEIKRGIKEAKPLAEYDNLSESAYLRAKEDYLMGINFSRLLSLRYGDDMASFLHKKFFSIAVGRVMTCVLGMVVRREREIRNFVKTPFYRVTGIVTLSEGFLSTEWKAVEGSRYYNSPLLYKDNGFLEEENAKKLIGSLISDDEGFIPPFDENRDTDANAATGVIKKIEKKKEKKNPPLLYNLAEAQNDCSRFFKISPDETLKVIQELYEKKLVTYPRTDARVLSTAVAKVIDKNIKGLLSISGVKDIAQHILDDGLYKNLAKTRYVDDKQITDHYAIIPTGQGLNALKSINPLGVKVYELIVRRFLAIFYPPAVYDKLTLTVEIKNEQFFANAKVLKDEGYLSVLEYSFKKKKDKDADAQENGEEGENKEGEEAADPEALNKAIASLKKGDTVEFKTFGIREGETTPPKRYNSGALILAMENAGKLIEDEELREQIKSQGIGTSATRAEILDKLVRKEYLKLNKKTQIITPTLEGEMVYDVVNSSIASLLNAELTASWEKGLNYVSEGSLSSDEYMEKLEGFIKKHTAKVLANNRTPALRTMFAESAKYYK